MLSYIWREGAAWSVGWACVVALGTSAGVSLVRGGGLRVALRSLALALPVTAILAATLTRDGWPTGVDLEAGFRWAGGGWLRFSTDFGRSEEIALNVALFVPAASVISWAWRRPDIAIALLALLSAAIEILQGVLGLGTPDLSDLLANVVGSVAGAVLGTAACVATRRPAPWRALVALTASVALLIAVVPVGASLRQRSFERTLRSRFDGATLTDYRTWSAKGQLGARVFAVAGVYSSGAAETEHRAVVSYPTSFLGIEQCALVSWTTAGTAVRSGRGRVCAPA